MNRLYFVCTAGKWIFSASGSIQYDNFWFNLHTHRSHFPFRMPIIVYYKYLYAIYPSQIPEVNTHTNIVVVLYVFKYTNSGGKQIELKVDLVNIQKKETKNSNSYGNIFNIQRFSGKCFQLCMKIIFRKLYRAFTEFTSHVSRECI